jgi:hypothetical protein
MIVETEITYRADAHVPRKRGNTRILLRGVVSVEVSEVSAAEAPVVIERGPAYRRERLRAVGGLMYRPAPEGFGESPEEVAAALVRSSLSWSSLFVEPPRTGEKIAMGTSSAGRYLVEVPTLVVSDQIDRIRVVAQEAASTLVVVDGVVHVRARSPLLDRQLVHDAMGRDGLDLPSEGIPAWFHGLGDATRRLNEIPDLMDADLEAIEKVSTAIAFDVVDAKAHGAADILANVDLQALPARILKGAGDRSHVDLPHNSPRTPLQARTRALKAFADIVENDMSETLKGAVESIREAAKPLADAGPRAGIFISGQPKDAATVPVGLPYPVMVPGKDQTHWFFTGRGDNRNIEVAEVHVPVVAATDLHPVAMHTHAGFPSTFWDGEGFVADAFTVHELPLTGGAEALGNLGRVKLEDGILGLYVGACMLSENDPSGRTVAYDAYGLAVRRPDATIRRESDEDAPGRILAEYAAHRMVYVDDGRLAYRCPEPLVAVRIPSKEKPWAQISHSWRTTTEGTEQPPFLFRLDAYDEAMDFMRSDGRKPSRWPQKPDVLDPSMLTFDSDLWNLKASMSTILEDVDGRVRLMPKEVVMAVARSATFIDVWRQETALSDTVGHEAQLVRDAHLVLSELRDPIYDDIGAEWVRDMAAVCIERLRHLMEAEPSSPDDSAEFHQLAM